MVDLWVRPWALHGCRPEAEAGHRLKQKLANVEARRQKQKLANAVERRRDRRRLALALAVVPSAVVCATDHKPNTRWSVRTLRCVRRASLRKNILQSWAPGQFHCELTFYDEHYLLNQYLYNHFESSVLIVANCSDYLHIELLLSYCVRVTVHYCVHAVSVISFLCVRAFIYHCVHIFTVLSCQISLCTRHCHFCVP